MLHDGRVSVEHLRLKDNHTWRSKPGYAICVLDRGAVRFDFPKHWVMDQNEGAVMLHDRKPSIESCDLGVSIFRVPAEALHEVTLDELLLASLKGEQAERECSEIHHIERGDVQISWLEQRYIEETQKKPAKFRIALARGCVHVLITMNYWAKRAPALEPVWSEVLRTLVLGVYVKDPTAGPVIQ